MQATILGWDIGGAHIKVALINQHQQVLQISQYPCPLWKGLDYLQQAVEQALTDFSVFNGEHVITMTGELVDLFASRDDGVQTIIQTMQQLLAPQPVKVFAGCHGFLPAHKASPAYTLDIASANWLATAQFVASRSHGLLVDIGSTTTDILLLADGMVQAQGFTDYQRLISGELLYTGIIRSAVMAVAQRSVFNGQAMGLMTEYFATMADVYRLTGDLHDAHDQADTADGGPKTAEASARRLSRLTGYEFSPHEWSLWQQFAQQLKSQQKQLIQQAIEKQLRRTDTTTQPQLIGAGVGRFLVQEIAGILALPYQDFCTLLVDNSGGDMNSADCAPAVAVACLSAQSRQAACS